jgi:hypothetical protein
MYLEITNHATKQNYEQDQLDVASPGFARHFICKLKLKSV